MQHFGCERSSVASWLRSGVDVANAHLVESLQPTDVERSSRLSTIVKSTVGKKSKERIRETGCSFFCRQLLQANPYLTRLEWIVHPREDCDSFASISDIDVPNDEGFGDTTKSKPSYWMEAAQGIRIHVVEHPPHIKKWG